MQFDKIFNNSFLYRKHLLAVLLSIVCVVSKAQIITTIVGNGIAGYSGDNNLASLAKVNNPNAVTLDKNGNLYITDCFNNRIRKVDYSTGLITTIVGTGVAGYNGDGILAINAQINQPGGTIAIDGFNNIYIADRNNHRIRKIDAITGIITTIAGTGTGGYNGDSILALNAQVNIPNSIISDDNNNLFIADESNHRIRRIDAITGMIATVAGNGISGYNNDTILATNAQLKFPTGLAIDSANNIIIADWGNNRVRKVNIMTGLITTIAGGGANGLGDGGLAINATLSPTGLVSFDSSWNLFVTDDGHSRIRKVDMQTGIITTVVGNGIIGYNGDGILATIAELHWGGGIGFDKCNNLYLADAGNNRIRKVWFNTDTMPHSSVAITPNDTVTTGTLVTTTASVNTGTIIACQWVKNGVATGTTASSYTYTPTNGDSLYCIVTARACTGRTYTDTTQVMHITVTGDAGITNTTNHTTYTYPNPVRDVLYISTTEAQSYELHNLMGVAILQGTVDKQNSIDMKAIPSGIYLLQLTNADGQREVIRVVKE